MGGVNCEMCGAGWTSVQPRAIADDVVVPLCATCGADVGATTPEDKKLRELERLDSSWLRKATVCFWSSIATAMVGAFQTPDVAMVLLGSTACWLVGAVLASKRSETVRRELELLAGHEPLHPSRPWKDMLEEQHRTGVQQPIPPPALMMAPGGTRNITYSEDTKTWSMVCRNGGILTLTEERALAGLPPVPASPLCGHCQAFQREGASGCMHHFKDGVPSWWTLSAKLYHIVHSRGVDGTKFKLSEMLKNRGGYDGWGEQAARRIIARYHDATEVYLRTKKGGAEHAALLDGLSVVMSCSDHFATVADLSEAIDQEASQPRALPARDQDLMCRSYK